MSDAELLRRRRCLSLRLAIGFGVLLPIFHWSWVTFVAAVVGVAVAFATYWRTCRDGKDAKTERSASRARDRGR